MAELKRVSVDDARKAVTSAASNALLVCGYDDEAKCKQVQLQGAINLQELKRREASLSPDQEIIFYCA